MGISGYATSEGTFRYSERLRDSAPQHFRQQNHLSISSIGIGTYLGSADDITDQIYRGSIVRAVQLGVNVIDTAANYRFQRSERAIGSAFQSLIEDHGFAREELIVCTKGGYIPFDNAPTRNVREYLEETFVKTGIASFDDFVGGSHCMTPAYLQNQLNQSLRNMNIECVDVYYVHNPESQLGHISEAEFYYRIRAAFERLEQNRSEMKLRAYGVATWNGFRVSQQAREYHSLERLVETARSVGGEDHGFRFIQLPFNFAMPEALTFSNQEIGSERLTLLEAAQRLNITVIASASILQGRVIQNISGEVSKALGSLPTNGQTAIQFVRSTPGITCALVGMSHVEHVEENLQLVDIDPVDGQWFSEWFQ